jgi:hypothetical protein
VKRSIPFCVFADPLAQTDVQHLPGVRAGGQDRVIPEQLRVPVGGALLQPPAHLADEAVHIDQQPLLAWPGASPPRAHQRFSQQRIQLAYVTESERPQERPQRRGCRHPATQKPSRATRPQHLAVIDAVRAEHHREQQRHHLAPRVRGTRTVVPQPHQPPSQHLDPQPLSQHRDEVTS